VAVMKINWRSILGYLFIVIAIALVSIASSLVFDPERIVTAEFWIIVGLKTLVSLLTFNIIYFNLMIAKKMDMSSALGMTWKEYAKYVARVYKDRLQPKVRERIEQGNKARFEESASVMLHRITTAVSYKDLFEDGHAIGDIRALVERVGKENMLTRKETKRLLQSIKRVLNGKVSYERLDYNHIMLNNDIIKNAHPKMVVNEKSDLFVKNINIAFNGLILSALFTIFALGELNNLFYEIISNGVTIAFAIFNANVFSIQVANKLKNAYQTRKDFFCDFIEEPLEEVKLHPLKQAIESEETKPTA
jgi:hypothetical protein